MAGRVLSRPSGSRVVFVEGAGVDCALGECVYGAIKPGREVAIGVEMGMSWWELPTSGTKTQCIKLRIRLAAWPL